MTSIKTEKQEVGCSYRHRRSHCSLLTVSNSVLHPAVLEAPFGIITMNRHTVRPKGYLKTIRYIYSKILILQIKNAHSAVLLSRGIQLNISTKVEVTVPTQLTFHCRLFSSYSMAFRQRKGGSYNTGSTHLSLSFIFVIFSGFSSTQRWRLQYRLNTPFTVVYFRHILWFFVNAKVEATIPTQHTFHSSLFPSHSMPQPTAPPRAPWTQCFRAIFNLLTLWRRNYYFLT